MFGQVLEDRALVGTVGGQIMDAIYCGDRYITVDENNIDAISA